MISLINLIEGYSGYKMSNVGSGYGKAIAGPFAPLGYYIGKDVPNHPENDIDESKKSHRVGVMTDEQLNAKRMGIGAGVGAGVGSIITPVTGTAIGALIGAGIGAAVGSVKAAKRLGYGGLGKVSSVLGPLTGLTTPKKIRVAGYDNVNKKKK